MTKLVEKLKKTYKSKYVTLKNGSKCYLSFFTS